MKYLRVMLFAYVFEEQKIAERAEVYYFGILPDLAQVLQAIEVLYREKLEIFFLSRQYYEA